VKSSPRTSEPPSVVDGVRSLALVAGAVMLVLGLLIGVVYAAVYVDIVPQLQ
jgi:hypothetical protein